MNDFIYIGHVVKTHGIKGEIRILSDLSKKDLVFNIGNNLYFGNNYDKEIINSYRVHKGYDMVSLKGYDNINDVLKYINLDVYIKRDELNIDDFLLEDLVDYNIIFESNNYGKVISINKNNNQVLLEVLNDKKYYIPFVDEYIVSVNKDSKQIIVKNIEGLML